VPQTKLSSESSRADSATQSARHSLLQHLYDDREISFLRLAQQQMNVFGHHDVTGHRELISGAHFGQNDQKHVSSACRSQERQASITSERDEVKVSRSVAAFEIFRHGIERTDSKRTDQSQENTTDQNSHPLEHQRVGHPEVLLWA